MSYNFLYKVHDGVATVTFNHPTLALSMTKRLVNNEWHMDLVSALENEAQALLLMGKPSFSNIAGKLIQAYYSIIFRTTRKSKV
ncbi:MAG: hypothetical protein HS114_37780 [Anaerolineales bacterium]|nr:hypothetical protein [Anaerolineales bacterium]